MSVADGVLLVLLALAIVAALLVVTSRRLVHSALWLAVVLAALAGAFVVLHAEFVAGVQLLIYVGAVVVLLVFGIMLTRSPTDRSDNLDNGRTLLALAVSLSTALVLVLAVGRAFSDIQVDAGAAQAVTARSLGDALFGTWVLPFEVLSVLLLAAVVGAISLSRRTDDRSDGLSGELDEEAGGLRAGERQ